MSLRGRKIFDVLQHHPSSPFRSSRFRLPCPPYHDIDYWNRRHRDMDPDDVQEWGGFDLNDGLLTFRYTTAFHRRADGARGRGGGRNDAFAEASHRDRGEVRTTTFEEFSGIPRMSSVEDAVRKYGQMQYRRASRTTASDGNYDKNNPDDDEDDDDDESIVLIGCGNSKFGEQLLMNSFVGPVLQIDASPNVIRLMNVRYEKYMRESSVKRMELIIDDAAGLTSLSSNSVGGGVFDKGLIDALHCSGGNIEEIDNDEGGPIRNIVNSVHRVLRPSRPFVFFSRSEPEYILRRTLGTLDLNHDVGMRRKWKEVRVLKLVDLDVLLYRFVKADCSSRERGRRNKRKY
jgi:hypothetical protein